MTSTTTADTRPTARPTWRRALVVPAAPLAGLVAWALLALVAEVDLVARDRTGALEEVGAVSVAVTGLVAALAGWALLAALERWTTRARVWTPVAWAVLVVSFGGALSGTTPAARAGLALLHVAVGVTVITLLAPRRERRATS